MLFPNSDLFYAVLDTPREDQLPLGQTHHFSGWFFYKKNPPHLRVFRIKVFHGRRLIRTCSYGVHRGDVYEVFRVPQAEYSGFEGDVEVPSDPLLPLTLVAEDEKGNQTAFLILRLRPDLLKRNRHFPFLGGLVGRAQSFAERMSFNRNLRKYRQPKKIVIAGFGRSGTTALAYRIKDSIPWNLRFFFEPREYDPSGERPNEYVLAKILFWGSRIFAFELEANGLSHKVRYDDFNHFDRKILLVRDPRDRLVSTVLYSMRDSCFYEDAERLEPFLALLRKKETYPTSVSFLELVEAQLRLEGWVAGLSRWKALFQEYMNFAFDFHDQHPDYFVVKYEDLVDEKLKGLESYLGFQVRGPTGVPENLERVVRTKGYGDWKHWFLRDDVEFFKPVFSPYMARYRYKKDWEIAKEPKIFPLHASEYVRRILAERREEAVVR